MSVVGSLLLASALAVSIASEPVAPKGWTCHAGDCRPVRNYWLGFHLGMAKHDALGAALAARIKGYFQEDPEAAPLGHCNNDSCEGYDFAELRDHWYFLLSGTRCTPSGEPQHLLLEFGNGHLTGLISNCKPSPADLLPRDR
jgi:hypothetical protein